MEDYRLCQFFNVPDLLTAEIITELLKILNYNRMNYTSQNEKGWLILKFDQSSPSQSIKDDSGETFSSKNHPL